jgi:hypothetical protein
MLMVDLQGIWEWWHFKEKGDLDPLLRIMESGALAPVVQRMMANDMRQEETQSALPGCQAPSLPVRQGGSPVRSRKADQRMDAGV